MGEIPQVEFNRPVAPPPKIQAPQNHERPMFHKRERSQTVSNPTVVIKTGNFRTIGHSGSITLNRALLIEMLGFGIGDSFEIFREDDKVVLQKAANPM